MKKIIDLTIFSSVYFAIMAIIISLILIGVFIMNYEKETEVAVISTKYGDMVVEFYPDVAPMHVESFVALANEQYFDGTTFHRVITDFVIQGGDPNSKLENRSLHGTGGRAGKFFGIGDENDSSTWLIPQEFNSIPHEKGILSMARTNDPNSASSQFFVCHGDPSFLDNNYTVFGKVIQGLEVIDSIANIEKDMNDNPLEKIEMTVKMAKRSEVIKD
jgi:peptidyl-prolyl cis-trans isomerase B (cyclophilin B)